MRSHLSCLFDIGQSQLVDFRSALGHPLLVDFVLRAPTLLVFYDVDHPLLLDFVLRAPTRLIFLVLVSHCWWTLSCAHQFVLSYLTLVTLGIMSKL